MGRRREIPPGAPGSSAGEPPLPQPPPSNADPRAGLRDGVVVRVDRKQVHVELDGAPGVVLSCALRGHFFEGADADPESRPAAVGDRVRVRVEGDHGAVEEILPRRSRIFRPQPRSRDRYQVIAANVDLLAIVVSLREPDPRPGLVDRLLVAAESEGIDALLVLNKTDLANAGEAEAFAAPYRGLGYPVLPTSAKDGVGIDALRDAMRGRTAMLLGHSGVGKSSLLVALDPAIEARIGALVETGKGQRRGSHTTTASALHTLSFGARLVDTPGVREFGLGEVEPSDLGHWFREFKPHLARCRYATCTHDHEPGCGVKAAVESGAIRHERYDSYRKLLAELKGQGERMPRHDSFGG